MSEQYSHFDNDPFSIDENTLPIPAELDRYIRLTDLLNACNIANGEQPDDFTKDMERFAAAKEHWETANEAQKLEPKPPITFDMDHPLIAAYFAKIKAILDKQNLTVERFSSSGSSMSAAEREKIHHEAIRIARDIILIIRPETYNKIKYKIQNPHFVDLAPEQIITGTAKETLGFYESTGKRPWSQNPVAWARDCLLLLLNPQIITHLRAHDKDIHRNARPTVEGWIKKMEPRPPAKEHPNKSSTPDLQALELNPDDIDEEMARAIIETIRKAQIDTHDHRYNASYAPRIDAFAGSVTRMITFLNRFFENYEGDKNQLQYRMYIAAKEIAEAMQKQKKPVQKGRVRDMTKVLEAITEFRTMAIKADVVAQTTGDNKIYKAETDPKRNIPAIRIIQQTPPKLICTGKTLEELATHPGITQEDMRIARKLLRPPENEEEKIRNFKINEQWDHIKFTKKDLKPIRILFTLTHFLASTLPKLYPSEIPENPAEVQGKTKKKTGETMRWGNK